MTEPVEFGADNLPIRQAVRGLLIDRQDRIAMVKLDLPEGDGRPRWTGWVLPGGGIEQGEDKVEALRRELLEETGLVDAFVGPVVCLRRQIGTRVAAGYGGQSETIYLVPCHDHELAPTFTAEELLAENVVDYRWFTLDELRNCDETIVPGRLPTLVDRVLEYGGSVDPLVIDVVEKEA